MSVPSVSKCVFCTFARSSRQAPTASRNFSSSPSQLVRKPKFPSVKAPKARLNKIPTLQPDYLEKNFTSQQRAAIEAASKLINNENIQTVEKNRHPWSPRYVDDLTQIDPAVDHPVRAPWKNTDERSRLKTTEEFTEDFYKLMKNMPEDDAAAVEAWKKLHQNMRLTVGKEEAEKNPRFATAPTLPKLNQEEATSIKKAGNSKGQAEPSPGLLRLMQMTGLDRTQISKLRVKTIVSHRVSNQTRLGKIGKMYHLSVAGNEDGLIGIGEGKGEESMDALIQSQYRAIRNMQPVMRYEARTIFGEVNGKVGATELELYARPPGFGLRCQQYIFEICRAAGISDLAARVTRSRNPMNTVKATIQALQSQKDPEEIAKARGKKLVDVRKVYYANQV